MSILCGCRVLSTRPAAQTQALAALLRERGATPVELPLFRIVPHGEAALHRQRLDAARHWSGWIFTSANAARCAAALDDAPWPSLFAVGAATAHALTAQGRAGAQVSETGTGSEALLAHPALRAPRGERLLICTGVDGRTALDTELAARGAHVERLELYAREPVAHAAEEVARAISTVDAMLCTSGQGVERLHAITPDNLRPALLSRLLVVPSPRVLELARRLGFSAALAPAQTSDEALVACLELGLAESARPPR